jgi:hypothetical protein
MQHLGYDFFFDFWVNFQGKEGTQGTKSTGEASSIGERTHGEKANC